MSWSDFFEILVRGAIVGAVVIAGLFALMWVIERPFR